MNDGNPTSTEGEPAAAPKPAYDFSILQGLQVVGVEPAAASEEQEASWAEALRLEFEARAARFRQAVDSSIVLASDGVIRWLGDPIAKLSRGGDLLTPGAVLLADSRLPESARETVAARLELWLAALTKRLLGPLFALKDLPHEAESVRDLGAKLATALGVLDRDGVRGQVKRLDQEARAALRKHGVRFGAHYVYVPTSLKPAARTLALQLWALETPEADAEALRETLLPLASSGRTSLPADSRISRDGYRVAGFRPCGERAVRVDIVERLADLIRAAFAPANAGRLAPAPGGFAVSGQMTSLAGCSGESFCSILRSLGFESFTVRRSELPAPPVAPRAQPPETTNGAHQAHPTEAEAPAAGSAVTEDAAAEPEAAGASEVGDPAAAVAASEAKVEPPTDPAAMSEALPSDPVPAEAETAEQGRAPTEAVANASGPPGQAEETVTLWRPARRGHEWRRSRDKSGRLKAEASASAPEGEAASESRPARLGPAPGKNRRFAREVTDSAEKEARPEPGRRERERAHEKTQDSPRKRAKQWPKPTLGPPPQAAVDTNSPFAKLLELRPLLEKQAKNRT